MRESTVRGAAIDISDFERRLRGPEPVRKSPGDPLSELARLMQGEEQASAARRYDQMFKAEPVTRAAPKAPDWRRVAPPPSPAPAKETFTAESRDGYAGQHSPVGQHVYEAHEAVHYEQAPADEPYYAEAAPPSADFAAPYADQRAAQSPSEHYADDDDWEDQHAGEQDYGDAEQSQSRAPTRLRPWHVVAVIAFLGAGGVAWSLGHNRGVVGSREIATIKAPEGPAKIQPAAEPDASVDRRDATVLDRQENTPVKQVVSHQEQAVEPRVELRTVTLGSGRVNAEHEPAVGVTVPKKVKTVSVRPDGSLDTSLMPPAVANAVGGVTRDNASTTPKAATKPATTPKADKPARPVVSAKLKPAQKLGDEDAPAGGAADEEAPGAKHAVEKGAYAVQFGAPATEEEARAMLKQVAAKYGSRLDGRRPTFKMAKVGERTVYRVRVGGISKESAASLCGKIKAGGGDCFVAGN